MDTRATYPGQLPKMPTLLYYICFYESFPLWNLSGAGSASTVRYKEPLDRRLGFIFFFSEPKWPSADCKTEW